MGTHDLKMRCLICVDCQRFKTPVSEDKTTYNGCRRASERSSYLTYSSSSLRCKLHDFIIYFCFLNSE